MKKLVELRSASGQLSAIYEEELANLEALKQSLLHRAFSGELTGRETLVA